jgi:glycosyltransferase involved in cell wall biosynthesis
MTATPPLISIVMPCYNSAAFVRQGVESVLAQTCADFELIVVNDGSTDDSLAILQSITDPRLIVLDQPNSGVMRARNHGIARARGTYLAFLDADDGWREDFLEKMHAALAAHPAADLAYCGWKNVGLPGARSEPFIPPDYENAGKAEALLYECRWPIHGVLVKRARVVEVGAFDETIRTAEDYWLWLRIAPQAPIVRVPEVMSYYLHHGNQRSTAKNSLAKALDRWQIRQTFVARYPECVARLSPRRVRELTLGRLLDWGYKAYWQRDLATARPIFRIVMRQGYGTLTDWKYMLPAWLPLAWHRRLIHLRDATDQSTDG